jgi:hypothetical protein
MLKPPTSYPTVDAFQWIRHFRHTLQAEPWIRRARQQLQKTRGEDHPDVAVLRGAGTEGWDVLLGDFPANIGTLKDGTAKDSRFDVDLGR